MKRVRRHGARRGRAAPGRRPLRARPSQRHRLEPRPAQPRRRRARRPTSADHLIDRRRRRRNRRIAYKGPHPQQPRPRQPLDEGDRGGGGRRLLAGAHALPRARSRSAVDADQGRRASPTRATSSSGARPAEAIDAALASFTWQQHMIGKRRYAALVDAGLPPVAPPRLRRVPDLGALAGDRGGGHLRARVSQVTLDEAG